MALITIDDVKLFLGITDASTDAELQAIVDYVCAFIQTELGRNIEEIAIIDEIHETDGYMKNFFLKEWPINLGEAFTVEWDNDAFDATAYEVDDLQGVLYMNRAPRKTPTKFTVTYTGGYDPVPEDIKLVAVMLAANIFQAGGGGNAGGIGTGGGDITSQRLGDYSESSGGGGTNNFTYSSSSVLAGLSGMIHQYENILNNYRRNEI